MLKKTLTATAIATTLVTGLGFSGSAYAAASDFTACTGTTNGVAWNIADNVSPTTACAILLPLDGATNDSTALVNSKAFFTYNNWFLDGKLVEGDSSNLFNWSGNTKSGNFTLVGSLGTITDIMLVFKDGGDTNLVAYMLDLEASIGGSYSSPFEEPPFTFSGASPRDISHISVYYRTEGGPPPQEVPEPAPLALLGLGIVGLLLARRQRRA